MTHPSDLLERYSAGLLPPSTLVAIDGHLEECAPCRTDLAAPPAMDLERAWTAITERLSLEADHRPAGARIAETGTETVDTPRTTEAPVVERPTPPRRSVPWFRRPAVVFAASAVAVLLVVGGVALLLGPFDSDTAPVVTEAPTSTVTTTPPTTTAVETVTTSSIPPTASASVIVPAEVVVRGTATVAGVDTAGETGALPAMAIGGDGLPVIAYLDRTDGVINVAKCASTDCSGDNIITTLGPADGETAPAVALSPTGLPVVAYGAVPDEGELTSGVMLARCDTVDCTAFTTAPLPIDTAEGIGSFSVVVGAGGRPVVFLVGENVYAAACQDQVCSATTLTTIDAAANMGPGMTSAAVGPDGIPIVAYRNGSVLKLAVCDDEQCAGAATVTVVENLGDSTVSLTSSPAGMPVIAYTPDVEEIVGASTIGVVTCADRTCTESSTAFVEVGAAASVAIAVTPAGLPVSIVSFREVTVVSCTDPQCAEPATVTQLDTEALWGGASVAIGPDGMPRFAYSAGSDLKVAACTAMPCLTELPPPPPPGEMVTTVVSEADAELIGANPSLLIDAAGLPMVMYTTGQETPQPKLVRCLDAACSVHTSTTVDIGGFHNTLALGPDGLPAVAHHDWDHVYLTRCNDASCTTTSTVELEAAEFGYTEPVSVAFDPTGAPIVAFHNGYDYYIHVVACDDAICSTMSSGRVETFADAEGFRYWTNTVDIVIPRDGLPVVAAGQSDGAVRVAKCADRACTESTATIVDATGLDNLTSDMILGSDDLPLIAYYADGNLRAAKCENPQCTEYTVTTVSDGIADFIASVGPSIAVGADGLPVIAYWAPGRVLQLASCNDQACATSTVSTFGNANTFALAIGIDGAPVIAYHDEPELVVAKCGDAACGSG